MNSEQEPDFLLNLLHPDDHIYFYPNPGNLGDLLIAEATRQFFHHKDIKFEEYNPDAPPLTIEPYTLIIGGGGLSCHWGGDDILSHHLTSPMVKQGIILAHSFYGVDSFIQSMDSRHTLICRDEASFDYCNKLNTQSRIILGHDMALLWQDTALPLTDTTSNEAEEIEQKNLLEGGWYQRVLNGVKKSTITSNNKKIAFILRRDKEKATFLDSSFSYDISIAYSSSCRKTKYTNKLVAIFAEALSIPDIIVTDRLHVGIMGHLLGKEVYLLDNDYGKLSGIYKQSLKNSPNIHMLPMNQLTPELQKAWDKMHSPLFRLFRKKAYTEKEYHFRIFQKRVKKTKMMILLSIGKRKQRYINKLQNLLISAPEFTNQLTNR